MIYSVSEIKSVSDILDMSAQRAGHTLTHPLNQQLMHKQQFDCKKKMMIFAGIEL